MRPALILPNLNLDMAKSDGSQMLEEIRTEKKLKDIPVVMAMTSLADMDAVWSSAMRARTYIMNQISFEALLEAMQALDLSCFPIARLPIDEAA